MALFLEQLATQEVQQEKTQLIMLITSGIKAGTDAFKSDMAIENFEKAGRVIQSVFSRENLTPPPYSKNALTKNIRGKNIDPPQLKRQLEDIPNLAAECMQKALERLELKDLLSPYEKIKQDQKNNQTKIKTTESEFQAKAPFEPIITKAKSKLRLLFVRNPRKHDGTDARRNLPRNNQWLYRSLKTRHQKNKKAKKYYSNSQIKIIRLVNTTDQPN